MNAVLAALVLKSVALLIAASILAWLLRKQSAATRHLVSTAAFLALLALPFLSVSLPSFHFAPADKILAPIAIFAADATTSADRAAASPTRPATPQLAPRRHLPNLFPILWAFGAAIGCARLLTAHLAVARLRRQSRLLYDPDLSPLARHLGMRRTIELCETSLSTMPMTAGYFRPAIFLPAESSAWPAEKRRAVLLHELAHVRRHDVSTQLLARLALSLYWWNPLAWLAWREFLNLRERAADDLVLEAGARASDYAAHLVDIARSAAPAKAAVAAIAMAQKSQLEARLTAILDPHLDRQTPGRIATLIATLTAVAIVAPLAAIHAQDAAPPADIGVLFRVATSQNNFEMLDNAADGYIKNRQYDVAQKILDQALEVRAKVAGTQSETYSDGLLKLGDLEWDHFGARRAKDDYGQAVALGDRPETAQALLRLALLNYQNAEAYVQRSLNAGAKGNVYAEALAWMAEIRDTQGDTPEVESLFARARSSVKQGSIEAALIEEMYAAFLVKHGRKDEAWPIADDATKFRADHIKQLTPEATLASEAKKLGGNVRPPKVFTKVEPEYSEEARALKVQGTATLRVIVGPNGKAGSMVLVHGIGFGLDEKALDAVSRWTFTPATVDGAPVPVLATIEINFRLL